MCVCVFEYIYRNCTYCWFPAIPSVSALSVVSVTVGSTCVYCPLLNQLRLTHTTGDYTHMCLRVNIFRSSILLKPAAFFLFFFKEEILSYI